MSLKKTHTDRPRLLRLEEFQLLEFQLLLVWIKISTKQHLVVRVTVKMQVSSIIVKQVPPTPLQEVYMEITETELEKMSSFHSKMLKKIKWYLPIQISRLVVIMDRSLTTLKIQSFFIRCSVLITSFCVQYLNAMVSVTQSLMNGTSFGALLLARVIYMKDWTSSRKSITSLNHMKSPERTVSVTIWFVCKKNLEKLLLISSQIPISSQMNLVTFMLITKS